MNYVTGDTHGNQLLLGLCVGRHLKEGDNIIILGDAGIGFFDNKDFSEKEFFDIIAQLPYRVLCVDGNHDEFPRLNDYPVVEWNGGLVHEIRKDKILHLMRGEIYHIDGKKLFVFGGGSSLDRERRIPSVDWWPEEMPSEEEYENAKRNLERCGYRVDYILTHTAPIDTIEYMTRLGLGIKRASLEEMPLTGFLSWVQSTVEYKHWFFGHFHVDRELWKNQYAVLNDIRELHSAEKVWSRDLWNTCD